MADDVPGNSSTSISSPIGEWTISSFHADKDADWFRVTLEAGKTYRFALSTRGANMYLSQLTLRDSNGNALGESISYSPYAIPEFEYTPTVSGTYYMAAQNDIAWGDYAVRVDERTAADDFAAGIATKGVIAVGSGGSGVAEVSGDTDWFRFDYTGGKRYSFGFETEGMVYGDITLHDAAGKLIPLSYPFEPINSGSLFVAFKGEQAGNYKLFIRELQDDYSEFDTTTGTLAKGGSVTGQINYRNDYDAFKVSLDANVTYTFRLSGAAVELYNVSVMLRDASGKWIEGTYYAKTMSVSVPTAGTYYAVVRTGTGTSGAYTLTMEDPSASVDDHGNTVATATIAVAGQDVAGKVNSVGDVDMMRVQLEAGVNYMLDLTSARAYDFQFDIYGPDGVKLADRGMPGRNLTPEVSGYYYVAISSAAIDSSYTWKMTGIPDDYKGNIAGAGALTIGTPLTAVLNAGGDRDCFAVDLVAGQTYQVSLDGISFGTFRLLGSDGNEQRTFDLNRSQGVTAVEYTATASGRYYIEVGYPYTSYEMRYTLGVRQAQLDDVGDTIASARALANNVAFNAEFGIAYDTDVFKFTVTAGQDYAFEMGANWDVRAGVSFRDSNGDGFYPTSHSSYPGKFLTWRAATSGDVYITLKSEESKNGSYSVKAWALPNDEFSADRNTTGALSVGNNISGIIGHRHDVDWVKVKLDANLIYRFVLKGSGTDALEVNKASFSLYGELMNSALERGWDGKITFKPSTSGTYYLGVEGGGATGGWTIQSEAADEYANGPYDGAQLELNQTMAGKLGTPNDVDSFRIKTENNQAYQFNLEGALGSGTVIRIYDSSRFLRAESSGGTSTLRSLTYTSSWGGDHFVEISSTDGNLASYTLTAKAVNSIDDHGNTETLASTYPGPAQHRIDAAGDIDVFRMVADPTKDYMVTLSNSGPNMMSMVASATGSFSANSIENTGWLNRSVVSVGQAQDLYFKVSAADGWVGPYGFSITPIVKDDYSAHAGTKGAVQIGGSATGLLGYYEDVDWFAVTMEAGKYYDFELTGMPGELTLMDAAGTVLANGVRDTILGMHLKHTAAAAGKYYVAVSAKIYNFESPYKLTATTAVQDLTAPVLLSSHPASAAQGVSPYATLKLNFSEDVRVDPNNIALRDVSGKAIDAYISFGGSVVTINPYQGLVEGASYSVVINKGGVTDTSGNSVAQGTTLPFQVAKIAAAATANADNFQAQGSGATIDGGPGIDTVMYHNDRSAFTVSRSGTDVYVQHSLSTVADRLVGVERAVFSDGAIAFDTAGTGGQAYRLYQAAFNRTPDTGGVGYWMSVLDSGGSLAAVADSFINSAEFKSLYGAAPTNAAFVNLLYTNVLHRPGEQAGIDFWIDSLEKGVSRRDLLMQFSESAENQAGVLHLIANGFDYTPFG